MGNIEDLIEANEISLFDKNSYMYDDLSVNPDISKRTPFLYLEKIPIKKPENNPNQPCQLDLNKLKNIFLQANIRDREI